LAQWQKLREQTGPFQFANRKDVINMKQDLVRDWMTRNVITITPDTSLPEAHRLMKEHQIRRLPVVKGERLIGIVTLGDVREAEPSDATSLSIWELNYLLSRLKVETIMTRDLTVIYPDETIGQAAWLMLTNKISGLPVVDTKRRVTGIITESDIFRLVVHEWRISQTEDTTEMSLA
jgi:CBS domain-containing protein